MGDDVRGARALERMRELGLSTRFVRTVPQATGIVTVKLEAGGQPRFTIHRPAAYDFASLDQAGVAELAARRPDWIYFGTLYQMTPQGLALTRRILEAFPAARRFYDINLRVDSYTPVLIRELMSLATVVKLNDTEVAEVESIEGMRFRGLRGFRARVRPALWMGSGGDHARRARLGGALRRRVRRNARLPGGSRRHGRRRRCVRRRVHSLARRRPERGLGR